MSMNITMGITMGMPRMEKRQLRPWRNLGVAAKPHLEKPRA
jgi:hypothetical protein